MEYTREQVLKVVGKYWSGDMENQVLELLKECGESNRVHLAIIKLSSGAWCNLMHFVKEAKTDYRDVLHWAEYDINGKKIENPYKELID